MLAALNEAAGQAARDATCRVTAGSTTSGGGLRSAQAAHIERDGRARLGELAVQAAEAWRQEQARRLEDGLARLDERLPVSCGPNWTRSARLPRTAGPRTHHAGPRRPAGA